MTRLRSRVGLVGFLVLSTALSACAGNKTKSGSVAVPQEQVLPLVGALKVHRYTLSNGLRLLVVENHSSPTLAYQTWMRVGSKDEVPGRTGLAHLFEHLMFKATKNHPEGEFDKILESNGTEDENAFTNHDYTAFVEEMPADKLSLLAKLESDRMENLLVNDQSFKTEREVVQNERRYRNENSPDGLMYQELFETAFTKHPYHWPVIGYSQDLEAMTAQDARNFYKSYYSPNHATIVISGDVDPDKALDTIKKYYGDLPAASSPAHVSPTEPPQTSPRHKVLKLNIQVDKLLMAYHIPDSMDPTTPTLSVIQYLLTGGKSSRLSRALVNTGIASSVDAEAMEGKDPALFLITVNLQKGKKAAQAEAVILRELAKIRTHKVSTQELDRTKNRIDFDFYEQLGNNSDRDEFLGLYETIDNDFQVALQQHQKSREVTPDDVMSVAKKFFSPKSRTVIVGVPK